MTELNEILERADYRAQLRHQKEILDTKFQDACVFAHSGGLFDLTGEFLAGVHLRSTVCEELWLVDRNNTPVLVKNPKSFLEDALVIYNQATAEYGTEYFELRRKRSVQAIIPV